MLTTKRTLIFLLVLSILLSVSWIPASAANTAPDGDAILLDCSSQTSRPAVPVAKGGHDAATGKNKLTWDAVENAVSYKVYRSTSKTGTFSLMKTTTSLSYINSTAEAGKTYYYKVKAVAADGTTSAFSEVKALTCDLAQPVVKATNVASTGYNKLTWNAVPGATAYKVYRSTSRSGSYTLMKTVKDGTSYVNSNAEAGKTYFYYVVAVMDGVPAADSAKSEIKVSTCDLAQPSLTLFTSAEEIYLKWDAVQGATGYKIYRATSSTGEYKLVKTVDNAYTAWDNTGLTAGRKYFYKVVAVMDGKSAATSAYSAAKSASAKQRAANPGLVQDWKLREAEEWGRQYAVDTWGYRVDLSLGFSNSGYYPGFWNIFDENTPVEKVKSLVKGAIDATSEDLIACDGAIWGYREDNGKEWHFRINIAIVDNGDGYYACYAFYG